MSEIIIIGRRILGNGSWLVDVIEFIEANGKELSLGDLLMQLEDNKPIGGDEIDDEASIQNELPLTTLSQFLQLACELRQKALDMNPDGERREQFCRNLAATVIPYRELY